MRLRGFIGPSYTLDSYALECQRCVNLYPEIDELQTAANGEAGFLVGTPGLRKVLTLPTGPVRGLYRASNNNIYAVGGNKLYWINTATWSYSSIGTLNSNDGPVSMADNGLQLILVDGANGYILTFTTSTFLRITSSNWHGADRVYFVDGYFVFNWPGTQKFYITALYDGYNIDNLDFASAEGSADLLVSMVVDHREVWLFGSQSVEVWFDSGDPNFPFQRTQGFIEFGCSSPYSAQKVDNSVVWVSDGLNGGGVVYRASNYLPQRISNFGIENALSGADLTQCTAWTYQQGGHYFYALNVPDIGRTFVWDSSTGQWHERTYLNNGQEERHRVSCHAFLDGLHIAGDYADGRIYLLDLDYFTDDGSAILRERTTPHLSNGLLRTYYTSFELDCQLGTGTSTGQGKDPQVMLQWSDDKGFTWSNEHWTSMGPIGSRVKRARWTRLGNSRDRVFRLRITDPVKVRLRGVELGVMAGSV